MNPTRPTSATGDPVRADEESVLADVVGMITALFDEEEYGLDDSDPDGGNGDVLDLEIGMETTFNRDLELESIDLVTLAGFLEERYGGRVNFAEFMADMEFDEIIELTVGRLVEHIVLSLKAAEAG
ncbi:phosphopantetheine-binding protein [Streptomyces sp. NPDC047022]|uniref:acyl carrier protein n=1 Tax=Streptomyces sp. NPDC047022 TaxID=3155737 RepID=UPI0033E40D27